MTMAAFEELDRAKTPLGELILRRREVLSLDRAEVFEVKLAGEFLMSSIVNDAEIALAQLALPFLSCDQCDVLVGGLGLGHTAKAALDTDRVATVTVIEYLEQVISWHQRELVPLGKPLTHDARCRLVHADFFAVVGSPASHDDGSGAMRPEAGSHGQNPRGLKPSARNTETRNALVDATSKRFHAILLDIDHSPQCLLHAGHGSFYTSEGFERLTNHLQPGGVFALWSADPPEASLMDNLRSAFATVEVLESKFFNPLLNLYDTNYIVVAQVVP